MAQTFNYTVVGDTQPAVKGNEALDASIKQVDTSSKQLESSLAKSGEALELSLQKQDAKIKAIGGSINILGGSVELVVGTLGLIGVDEKIVGQFQKAAVSAIAFADGAKRVFEGYKEISEAKKIFAAVTRAETVAEVANTGATVTNTTATVAGTVATNAGSTATKAFSFSIKGATAALRAFALANPFLAIIVGITAAAGAIALFAGGTKEASEEVKKLAEENERLKLTADDVSKGIRQRNIQLGLLGKTEFDQAKIRLGFARQDLRNAAKANNAIETEKAALESLKASTEELQKLQAREIESRRVEEEARARVLELEFALGEASKKVSKERSEASIKASENIALAAAKQLEAEKVAVQDLIDLYEQFPEFFGERNRGQFEFNTELDRTNFLLKEQLDVLFALNTEYEDLSEQLEVFTDDVGESFFSEDQLAIFKKLRDAQKTGLQLQLEDLENTYRSDLALFTDNEEMKSKITEQYEEDRAKTVRQYAIQNAQAVLGITSQFLNTIAQVNQASLELQLAQAAGNQNAINQINADALEQQKKLRIAQVLVTTAESVLNGFNATSTLPPPFNFIAGAALAAAYTALGAKSIQTINATTLEGGGGGGGFNNIPSGGGFSLPGGGGISTTPSTGALLPGIGGGFVAPTTIGTVAEPIRAYVLSGDVSNGVQAGIALNNRRRLSGG